MQFILNDRAISTKIPVGMTLLDFIRYEKNLTGTKIGCREGDCGACTVLIGSLRDGKMHYQSMTSCVTPLGNARNKHVVTIEGINMETLTPVQQLLVNHAGTQCGFCTVGFIVSFTAYCMTNEKPTFEGAVSSIDGNICRCTGYKSIERTAEGLSNILQKKSLDDPIPWLIENQFLPAYFTDIPARLREMSPPVPPSNGKQNENVRIGGGTDLYVQRHDDMLESEIDLLFDKKELNSIYPDGDRIVIGGAATPTDLMKSDIMQGIFPKLYKHMKLISSTQIRNMGTIAGNFVNASPIGDLTAWFLALDTTITLRNDAGEERDLPLKDFYLGYKVLNKQPDEIVTKLSFPIPGRSSSFNFEKVCKRTYLDIASVNTAIQADVTDGVIQSVYLSAGGVGPTPKFLSKTCDFLVGKTLSHELLIEADEIIQSEISPISDVRGSDVYKRTLLRQLFFSHFLELYPESIRPEELV
jgi:xanthine dehydrogenase small subunit